MSSLQCPHHHGPTRPLTPQRHWAGSVCPLQVRLVWRLCWIRAGNQGAVLATMPAAHGQIETKATNSTGSLSPGHSLLRPCLRTGGKAQQEPTQPGWAVPGALTATLILNSFNGSC